MKHFFHRHLHRTKVRLHSAEAALLSLPGAALAVAPEPYRFRVAVWLARRMWPGLRLRFRASTRMEGYREEALHFVLDGMRRFDVRFQPELRVEGDEVPLAGALLISGHLHSNRIFLRWMLDHGRRVSALSGADLPPTYLGTRTPLYRIDPISDSLLRVKQRLAAGDITIIPADSEGPHEGWRRVDTPVGPRYVGANVFRFVQKVGVPLRFYATRVGEDGLPVTRIVCPRGSTAEELRQEFCAFLGEEAHRIAR